MSVTLALHPTYPAVSRIIQADRCLFGIVVMRFDGERIGHTKSDIHVAYFCVPGGI